MSGRQGPACPTRRLTESIGLTVQILRNSGLQPLFKGSARDAVRVASTVSERMLSARYCMRGGQGKHILGEGRRNSKTSSKTTSLLWFGLWQTSGQRYKCRSNQKISTLEEHRGGLKMEGESSRYENLPEARKKNGISINSE